MQKFRYSKKRLKNKLGNISQEKNKCITYEISLESVPTF